MSGFEAIAEMLAQPLPEEQKALEEEQQRTIKLLKELQERASEAAQYEIGKSVAERLSKLNEALKQKDSKSQEAQIRLAEKAKADFEKKLKGMDWKEWLKTHPTSALVIGTGLISLISSFVLDENSWLRKGLRFISIAIGLGSGGYSLLKKHQDTKALKQSAEEYVKASPSPPQQQSTQPQPPNKIGDAVPQDRRPVEELEKAKKETSEKGYTALCIAQEAEEKGLLPEERVKLMEAIRANDELKGKAPNDPEVQRKCETSNIYFYSILAAYPDDENTGFKFFEKVWHAVSGNIEMAFIASSTAGAARWVVSKAYEIFKKRGIRKILLDNLQTGDLAGAAKAIEKYLEIEFWSLKKLCDELFLVRTELEKIGQKYIDLVNELAKSEGLLKEGQSLSDLEDQVIKRAREILDADKKRGRMSKIFGSSHIKKPECEELLAIKEARTAKITRQSEILGILKSQNLVPGGTDAELIQAAKGVLEKFRERRLVPNFFAGENQYLLRGRWFDSKLDPSIRALIPKESGLDKIFQAMAESPSGAASAERILDQQGWCEWFAEKINRALLRKPHPEIKKVFAMLEHNADQVVRVVKLHGGEVVEGLMKVNMTDQEFVFALEKLEITTPATKNITSWEELLTKLIKRFNNPLEKEFQRVVEIIRAREIIGLKETSILAEAVQDEMMARELSKVFEEVNGGNKAMADNIIAALKARNITKIVDAAHASRFIKIAEGVKALVRLVRFVPPAAAGLGAIANATDAWQSFAMAYETQNNPELRNILLQKGSWSAGIGLSEFTMDVGFFFGKRLVTAAAVRGGARLLASRAIAGLGGTVALPLTIILESGRYMISSALEARAEVAMTVEDYLRLAQGHGREELLHRWYTTGEDLSATEKYDTFDIPDAQEWYRRERFATRAKIVETLIKLENGSLDYQRYRFKFIEKMTWGTLYPTNFRECEQLITQSKVFANTMMLARDQTLVVPDKPSKSIDLRDKKYDPENIGELTTGDVNDIFRAITNQNTEALIKMLGKPIYLRLNKLDTNYIQYTINAIFFYLANLSKDNHNASEENKDLCILATHLVNFLEKQGMRFIQNPRVDPSKEEIENMKKIYFDKDLSAASLQEAQGSFTPSSKGVAAFYELAKFYGYKGGPSLGKIKHFFNEEHASMYGVYWDGKLWRSYHRNGFDEEYGAHPDTAAKWIINHMRFAPSEFLSTRYDNVVQLTGRDDEEKKTAQIIFLSNLMEGAFDTCSVPYNSSEEDLKAPHPLDQDQTPDANIFGIIP